MGQHYLKLFFGILIYLTPCKLLFAQEDITVLEKLDSLPHVHLPSLMITPLPEEKPPHPYLFFGKEDLPDLKVRARHPELYEEWQQILQDAENPQSHPFVHTQDILAGSIAYNITGESKYAQSALKKLDALLDKGYNWTYPDPHAESLRSMNWDVGSKALSIAYAYDMLYELLTEKQKEKCLKALSEKIYPDFIAAHTLYYKEQNYFTYKDGHHDWWTNCYFSWNSHINATIGLAALATLWEIPESPAVLYMARESLKYTHPEFDQDSIESGGYDEGPMMWAVHLADLTRFYVALKKIFDTDDGFFALPGVSKSMYFWTDFVAPDQRYVPFGSTQYRKVIDPPSELYYLGKKYDNNDFVKFIDKHAHFEHLLPFAILWRPIISDSTLPPPRPEIIKYDDIQWAIFNTKKLYVPFKGGDNAANNTQLDVGNMLLWLNEENILHSPDCRNKETKHHNCLIINNEGQIQRDPKEKNFGQHSEAFAKIKTCIKRNENYYAYIDATPCYKGVSRYHRHIILTENNNIIVFDDVAANESASFEINWHTLHPIKKTNDSVFSINGTYKNMQVLLSGYHNKQSDISNNHGVNNLNVSYKDSIANGYFVTVFTPQNEKAVHVITKKQENKFTIYIRQKNETIPYIFDFKNGYYQYTDIVGTENSDN